MGRPPLITRESILSTARHAFARKGYAATTLADIASELNVTPAALLRYYRSKQELFREAMQAGEQEVPEFVLELRTVDPLEDPRLVLKRVMRKIIPFFVRKVEENIAVYMHEKTVSLTLPFDPRGSTPPARALALFENYFKRCIRAGTISGIDPRAAAMLLVGSLQSYVFINYVFKATPDLYPVDAYIDATIDLWTQGVIRKPRTGAVKRKRSGGTRAKVR